MKRLKKLLGLLIALVVLIGGYVAVQNMNQTTAVTEEEVSLTLSAHSVDELTGLSWTAGETAFSLKKADEGWQMADDASYPVKQEEAEDLAETLLNMTASRKLENIEKPADYGLETAAFTLTATWSDGSQTVYAMGSETPFGDGWYLSLGETGIAYVIGKDLSSSFDVQLNELTQMETIPTVEDVTRVTIGSTLDLSKADDTWTSSDGILLDGTKVDDLIADIESISWDELVTAKADDLSLYGLSEATTLTLHGAGASTAILIGSANESGDYYARLSDSAMVYTIASGDVSGILESSVDSLWSTALVTLPAENVAQATFTAGGKIYTYAAETGADLWSSLTALTANSRLTDAPTGEVLLTVEVTDLEGKTLTLALSEHSVDEYAATLEGRYALVPADKVDQLIRTVKSLAE